MPPMPRLKVSFAPVCLGGGLCEYDIRYSCSVIYIYTVYIYDI